MKIVTDKERLVMKRAAFRYLMENGIKTEEHLWFVLHDVFGVKIPRDHCCDDHKPLWEAVCDDFFHRTRKQAIRHCRGGGKTFQVGTTKAVKLIAYPGLRISNFAATENQANALFGYAGDMLGPSADPEIRRLIDGQLQSSVVRTMPRPVQGRTKPEGSVMKVLVGTLKGVNSSHVEDLVVDERAQMDDAVFKEAMGMMTARPPYPGVLTVLSTVKTKGDPMDQLMEEADDRGYKSYVSCILDVTSCFEKSCDKCKATRSFTEDRKDSKSFYDYCKGRIMGKALGHFSVDTALNKFVEMGLDAAKAQLLCLNPEGEESAFPQFDRSRQVVEYRGPDDDAFFVFGDFGKRDDCAWIKGRQVTHNGHRALHLTQELIGKGKVMSEWIPLLKEQGFSNGQGFLVDVAGLQTTIASKKSAIDYLTDEGWTVLYEQTDELKSTDRIRELFKADRLLIDPSCKRLIEAFERATNKSVGSGEHKVYLKVIKHNKYSHPIDAVRYGVNLMLPDDYAETPERYRHRGR